MSSAPARTVFDVITDFLASDPLPEDVLAFHLPREMETYALHLLGRQRAASLTSDEKSDLDDFMRADDMMTLLKAKTRVKLAKR